ncbi:hypothetical protein [Streptococcus suis]|uniref:hypothetical protein n=1 Tax=Streptococcus suis TaxID=1307 RepID=UPI0009458294|nr:hypothetical protein [Streptococcus suis]
MADGKVTIAVDLDGKRAQGDINSLKASLSGLGSSFKSVLGANLVSGALMSGVNALAGGVKGAFSSAISEGAKLQQSIGGIETLFKDSAGTVKKYAESAFKTAGISANEYMENVTSFSASLIQSLGGDTAAAAELANTALMDMSDNANKMGSDMGMITQTYQSLARGNYQMLDNLKLGYGGTKAELQRLIKDSASYKDIQEELNMTVDEGDMSFANIVKAISVMQKKLDITGTTAKEASETFSGSFASMQAAFKDFLGNLTTGGDIKKPLENLAKTASTFIFRNFIPMVGNAFKALPGAIGTFISSAGPEIKKGLQELFPELDMTMFDKVTGILGKVYNLVVFTVQDIKDALSDMFTGFENTGALDSIIEAFEELSVLGLDISEKFSGTISWEEIGEGIGNVAKFLADAAKSGAEFIQSLPPGTLQAIAGGILGAVAAFKSIQTVTGIIRGVTTSFQTLKAVLSANPFMLAVIAISALVGAFLAAYNSSETFRNSVDKIVESVGNFISKLDPEQLKLFGTVIGGLLTQFMAFKVINGWNPFKMFGSGGKSALDKVKNAMAGTSGESTRSKGIIEQVFSGLGTLITSIAQGISTVLNGLATAISTVAQGFGQAAAMASPAQWLSMGAAMLMVGAGVALVSAGIYVLVQAAIQLASAGSGASIALAGLGVGIAALAGVFALLGPALSAGAIGIVAFGAAVALIGAGVYAASAGLSMLAGHLPTIATYGASAAVGIAALGAGLLVMGAGAMVAGAGLVVVGAGLTVVGAGAVVAAAGAVALGAGLLVAAAGVAAFGVALNVGKPGLTAFANAITKVVNAISSGFVAILNSISGVITSVGQAALNAGRGFNQLANGVVKITGLNLFDMGASLAAVATGLGAIAAHGAGLTMVSVALAAVTIGIAQLGSGAASATAQLRSLASSTQAVISAFNAMRGQVQSSMQAILSVVRSVGSQMRSQGRQIGQQTAQNIAQGIRGGVGQSQGAMQALMNAVRSVGMAGVGSMRGVGAMIGQGLAQGMMSALGSVTAAANALVAQAERAARAKAQIHSPSRLFRDSVGRFLPMGVAVGIEKNTKYVDKAMGGMYDNIQAFSYKAEDIIGVGKTKLSKVVQVKSDFENAIKAKVEVAKEKSNDLMEKALDIAEKAVERPAEMILDDGTLVAKTGSKYATYHAEQTKRENRMRGIVT